MQDPKGYKCAKSATTAGQDGMAQFVTFGEIMLRLNPPDFDVSCRPKALR